MTLSPEPPSLDPASLAYDDRGLVASVVQDIASGAVLMLAWANREAVERTLETGYAHFWSRSRQQLWKKGETSQNVLRVRDIRVDCDRDALLLRVDPTGPACHRGTRSCFEPNDAQAELGWLEAVLASRRVADGEASAGTTGAGTTGYTARLLAAGIPRIAQKVGEEAVETVIAALDGSDDFADEAADLLYHLLVLCQAKGVPAATIAQTLRMRHVTREAS